MLWKMIFVLGVLCVVYYLVLLKSTGTWRTTFSAFWLLVGVGGIGLSITMRSVPMWLSYMMTVVMMLLFAIFIVVEVLICFTMWSHPPRKLHCIIILGAQIRGVNITDSLKRRLDRGIRYLQSNPETMVIVSGGKGKGENISEALAMSNYLTEAGIQESRIIQEDQSINTRQNLKFSSCFIEESRDKVGIVSNNFHMYRALVLAKRLGYKHVYGIAASCKPIIFPNYMVREFFAVIQLQLLSRE